MKPKRSIFSTNGLPVFRLTTLESSAYGTSSLPSARWWYSVRSASDHPFWLQSTVSAEGADDRSVEDGLGEHPTRINDPAMEVRNQMRLGRTGSLYVESALAQARTVSNCNAL